MKPANPAVTQHLPDSVPGPLVSAEELFETLLRIAQQNRDPKLDPLVVKAVSQCEALQAQLSQMSLGRTETEPLVNARAFQRLMTLAGSETAIELLDQIIVDMRAAHAAIAAATPVHDWKTLRNQAHIVIAVAGSIGAAPVQVMAEKLYEAAQDADVETMFSTSEGLLRGLASMLSYVELERLGREKS